MNIHERDSIVALDKAHVWHPYTPMRQYIDEGDPIVAVAARGSRIFDRDGRSFLDGNSSWWTTLLGHNHPRLVRALEEQLGKFSHVPLADITHEPAALLASELVAIAPRGLSRVFYSDNGSTAVEAALKMSAQYFAQTGRAKSRFLALGDAFHGETMGVTALGGVEAFRKPFSALLMNVTHLPSPGLDLDRALTALERELANGAHEIAALVVEPLVQGAGGMLMYSEEFLRTARELTTKFGVHLICDEVFTGFGRTGTMWAVERAGIIPDLMCLAKGLSGGMLPFGATLVSEEIFSGFDGGVERAFLYGHTYCGNPLGAAIAREVLRVYADEKVVEGVSGRSSRILAGLGNLRENPIVSRIRVRGLVAAFDLEVSRGGYTSRAGAKIYEKAKRRGAIVRPLGNVIYLAPPLNITEPDLDELVAIVVESVEELADEVARTKEEL